MENTKSHSQDSVEIHRLDLEPDPPENIAITDVKHLASYNWIEALTPTIAVPGCPPQCGLGYIAQNAARLPDSPMEPLFRSLCIEQPSFDLN
ncbi:uncharacterized protein N7496_004039 [Penicillium cataractarum]|uniref:Uncharacterized protein n=1 Tax=Penicillium cataractarum TaxID=2100454 RepID=A0A9W9VJE6_9EURO|nr:uncharacterized protein N7496_004039 [Penicillium cataractarum]KAJ5381611.1 hypothetical protein N7496_004039 [Penicillium cataractarum]